MSLRAHNTKTLLFSSCKSCTTKTNARGLSGENENVNRTVVRHRKVQLFYDYDAHVSTEISVRQRVFDYTHNIATDVTRHNVLVKRTTRVIETFDVRSSDFTTRVKVVVVLEIIRGGG